MGMDWWTEQAEVQGVMSGIKAEAVAIVESYGGSVNQFVGDEILALFGIPAAHKDDPVRAVRAIDFALFCELEIPDDCPHVRKWYEGMEARESAKAHPGLVGIFGSYSKMMAG